MFISWRGLILASFKKSSLPTVFISLNITHCLSSNKEACKVVISLWATVTIFLFSTFKFKSIIQDFSSYKTLSSFLPCSENICRFVVCQSFFRVFFLLIILLFLASVEPSSSTHHIITSPFLAFARTSTSTSLMRSNSSVRRNKVTPVNVVFSRLSVNYSYQNLELAYYCSCFWKTRGSWCCLYRDNW